MPVTVAETSGFFRRTIVRTACGERSIEQNSRHRLLAIAAAVILFGGAGTARSGPCTMQIEQLEQQIGTDVPGPDSGPTAPQSLGAQLHHQPTPGSVGHAEHVANQDGDLAIDRAKKADADGDAASCDQALVEARRLYNVNQ
jgi:hypothetical protein